MKCKDDWMQIWNKIEKYKYIGLILLLGFVLMLVPEKKPDQIPSDPVQDSTTGVSFDLHEMESVMEKALGEIDGVGDATVVLSLSDGGEDILAVDHTGDGQQETVILTGAHREERPIRIKTKLPAFLGALVICDGGGNASVKLEVLRAMSAITGLSSDQITICRRK